MLTPSLRSLEGIITTCIMGQCSHVGKFCCMQILSSTHLCQAPSESSPRHTVPVAGVEIGLKEDSSSPPSVVPAGPWQSYSVT